MFNGSTITKAFNILGLNITTPGNHEFDFSLETYQNRLSEQKFDTTVANMKPDVPQTSHYEIFEISGIKVGVFGLITKATLFTSTIDMSDFTFDDYYKTTISTTKKLRE